jgi:hypothetical protein
VVKEGDQVLAKLGVSTVAKAKFQSVIRVSSLASIL